MKNVFRKSVLSVAIMVVFISFTAEAKKNNNNNGSKSNSNNYGNSSQSYKYNSYTYSPSKQSSSSKQDYPSSKKDYAYTSKPKQDYSSPKQDYKHNDYTYNKPKPTVPSVVPKPSSTPNFDQQNKYYKYNDYTFTKPKNNPGNNNSSNYNTGNGYQEPGTNKNGTIFLKDLKPGQGRTRIDGSTDKVHKDGKGYTHSFVDKNGTIRKESIRFDKTGKEVKISDTQRRKNGDVITIYKSGVAEIRTKDGLRYQQDRYGKTVYHESKSTWNNRPVIYRHYNKNYTTVYVQNNYYGYPSYFYRPTYFDYSYYNFSLTSWGRPVHYNWHWSYNPWYNQYYRPYPAYYAPAYWLTDYLLMSLIQSNYDRIAADNEVMAQQAQLNQVALNETIKEEIRVQVEQALRQQQQAVQTQTTMDPSQILTQGRLMVVHADLNVEDQNGSQCQLDEGDVIRLLGQPTAQNPIIQLSVVSAKGASCPIGTTLSLSATNLIEMESEFQARIQQGMNEMKSGNVGTN